MNLVFYGPPGAGKGTQAQKLSAQRGWPHISTGDLLRAAVATGTELGQKAKSYMDSGALVPDQLMCDMVAERLGRGDGTKGWILDGFPRTRVQAEALDATLARLGQKVDRCLEFTADKREVFERLVGRLTCTACNAVFHRKTKKPRADGVCDVCGGRLEQRKDDREETVAKRWSVYEGIRTEVGPYFAAKELLTTVDGMGTEEAVTARLERILPPR